MTQSNAHIIYSTWSFVAKNKIQLHANKTCVSYAYTRQQRPSHMHIYTNKLHLGDYQQQTESISDLKELLRAFIQISQNVTIQLDKNTIQSQN